MKLWRLAFLLMTLCACSRTGSSAYLTALEDAIRSADRIVIAEHSSPVDLYDAAAGKPLAHKEFVYRTVELNDSQRSQFLKLIEGLDPKEQDAFPACIFEGHHTVRFYAGAKLVSSLQVCFECGQVEWPVTNATPPWSLVPGLEKVIRNAGLQPKRDWAELARAHLPSPAGSAASSP